MENKSMQRKKLYDLLGDLPDRDYQIKAETISEEEREHYILEKLVLDLNGMELVPAYLAKPKKFENKLPAVLFNHSHGGKYNLGKDEFINGNMSYLQEVPYAQELTSLGYMGLCIDHWCFGERRGKTESELFKEFLWNGRVLWGMMVFDSIRALDFLASRCEADSERIATIGLSMGSTMAWWLAALDERIKVCIDICCMTDFEELIRTRGLDGHGIYYYVPRLLKHFSTSSINSLICPRHHLSLNGIYDLLTPVNGFNKVNGHMKNEYSQCGASGNWQMVNVCCGHMERHL